MGQDISDNIMFLLLKTSSYFSSNSFQFIGEEFSTDAAVKNFSKACWKIPSGTGCLANIILKASAAWHGAPRLQLISCPTLDISSVFRVTSWISLCICSDEWCHASVTSSVVNRCTLTPGHDGESGIERKKSRYSRRTFAWGLDLWTWRECWRRGVASAVSCFPCFRRTASVAGCLSVLRRLSAVRERDR